MDIDSKKLLTSDVIKQVAKEAGEKPKATDAVSAAAGGKTGLLGKLGSLFGGRD